jgi:hypothetical protein
MGPDTVPRIIPGMTLAVAEKDYLYGLGLALLRVRRVPVDQATLASLEWVLLDCQRLREDGSVLEEVSPMVRVSALAAAVRPTGWLPRLDQEREHG